MIINQRFRPVFSFLFYVGHKDQSARKRVNFVRFVKEIENDRRIETSNRDKRKRFLRESVCEKSGNFDRYPYSRGRSFERDTFVYRFSFWCVFFFFFFLLFFFLSFSFPLSRVTVTIQCVRRKVEKR